MNVLCALGDAYHVDTFDLYSARHRAAFLRQAAFELQLEDDQCSNDTAAAISRSIHEHGWQLYAIHYESRNLEKVFADISV